MLQYLLFLVCVSLLHSLPAQARWAKFEEATVVRTLDRLEWFVKADGTFTFTRESIDEVRKEAGRHEVGSTQLLYNPSIERLRVLAASVIQNGKEQAVPADFIQDKPLASNGTGFDQTNQIMIAFPGVEVGTKVRLKISIELMHPPHRGFFSQTFSAGMRRAQSDFSATVHSAKPLFVRQVDQEKFFRVKERVSPKSQGPNGESFPHQVDIRLLRPIYKVPVDEQDPMLNNKSLPWIDVATSTDWRDMVRPLLPEYERVLSAKLPTFLKTITKKINREGSSVDILNQVHAELANRMRYLGDWRPVNGGHVPRPLETIAATKFGDCKDFSAALVAILRSLGFEANVAIIFRGLNPVFSPTNLPSQAEFNHAIVWVKDAKGKEYWLDGTNPFAFAQGIPEDIADRRALVLAKDPMEKRTPALSPKDAVYRVKLHSTLQKDRSLEVLTEARYGGFLATGFIGTAIDLTPDSIAFAFLKDEADVTRLVDWKVEPVDLQTRIVRDLDVRYRFRQKEVPIPTSAGTGLVLPSSWVVRQLTLAMQDRVSDLPILSPRSVDREFSVSGLRVIGERNLSCSIRSPWIDFTRTFSRQPRGFTLRDEMALKAAVIPIHELHSSAFQKLQNELRDCVDSAAVVYEALP